MSLSEWEIMPLHSYNVTSSSQQTSYGTETINNKTIHERSDLQRNFIQNTWNQTEQKTI